MGKIARYLNQLTVGSVFDAPDILDTYATDHSVMKVLPKAVAVPESTDDIRKLMKFCYQLAAKGIKIPVTVRGAGYGTMGACLGSGLIISTERLNRLLESDRRERLVRVQAGITLREVNTALSINGLMVPVGGHDDDTIGGLISGCPVDTRAGKYGGILGYVERMEVVLANGDVIQTDRLGRVLLSHKIQEKTFEGTIYRKLNKLTEANRVLIEGLRERKNNAVGYPKITQVNRNGTLNLLPLLAGAEGTLGIISEVILRAVPIPRGPGRVLATFTYFEAARKFLDLAKSLKASELDFYDMRVIKAAEDTGKKLGAITGEKAEGFVVFAKFDNRSKTPLRKIASIANVLPRSTKLIMESAKNQPLLDEFEGALVSFLNNTRGGERVPLMVDFYLPADNIIKVLDDLKVLEKSLKMDLALYGSYGSENYHLRPRFEVGAEDFNKQAATFLKLGAFIVKRQGGTIAGGTSEGRVKAIVTNTEIPEAEKKLYTDIKNTFDRYGILNPGVKLGGTPQFTLRHFRNAGTGKIIR